MYNDGDSSYGGFYNIGIASLSGCTSIDNEAGNDGGAIYTTGGSSNLSVSGSTFTSFPCYRHKRNPPRTSAAASTSAPAQ